MIFVKSYTSTKLIAVYSGSTEKAVNKAVEEATEEMQEWIDGMEENAKEVKVISTSTQLAVTEDIVSYVITAIINVVHRHKE